MRERAFSGLKGLVAVLLAMGWASCDGGPPPPPLRDTGSNDFDGGRGFSPDGGEPFGRGDGGSRLPPADETIELPYLGDPVERTLEVEGKVAALDVFFSVDTTGSFGEEINNLQSQLRSTVLPALNRSVQDIAIGVGSFEDFPRAPFGARDDRPFRLITAITTQFSRVSNGVAALDQPLGNGGDIPEAGAEALYQIATGDGLPGGLVEGLGGVPGPGGGRLGGVGFRENALRVVVQVTDAPPHRATDYQPWYPQAHTIDEAVSALVDLRARVIGIASGPQARTYLESVALQTGASVPADGGVCPTGIDGSGRSAIRGACPLVFDVRSDGSGLSGTVVDAITDLLNSTQYTQAWAEAEDPLRFVRSVEADEAFPPDDSPAPVRADLHPPGDGVLDTFLSVRRGTRMRFRATLRNEWVRPADYDQYFRVTLRVFGDSVLLAERTLRIVVPRGRFDGGTPNPEPDDAGIPDAGPEDAGPDDAGPEDAGPDDAGPDDAGTPDAGTPDAGAEDAGPADAGGEDAGPADAGDAGG